MARTGTNANAKAKRTRRTFRRHCAGSGTQAGAGGAGDGEAKPGRSGPGRESTAHRGHPRRPSTPDPSTRPEPDRPSWAARPSRTGPPTRTEPDEPSPRSRAAGPSRTSRSRPTRARRPEPPGQAGPEPTGRTGPSPAQPTVRAEPDQVRSHPGRAGQDRTGPDRAEPGRAGPSPVGWAAPSRTGREPTQARPPSPSRTGPGPGRDRTRPSSPARAESDRARVGQTWGRDGPSGTGRALRDSAPDEAGSTANDAAQSPGEPVAGGAALRTARGAPCPSDRITGAASGARTPPQAQADRGGVHAAPPTRTARPARHRRSALPNHRRDGRGESGEGASGHGPPCGSVDGCPGERSGSARTPSGGGSLRTAGRDRAPRWRPPGAAPAVEARRGTEYCRCVTAATSARGYFDTSPLTRGRATAVTRHGTQLHRIHHQPSRSAQQALSGPSGAREWVLHSLQRIW